MSKFIDDMRGEGIPNEGLYHLELVARFFGMEPDPFFDIPEDTLSGWARAALRLLRLGAGGGFSSRDRRAMISRTRARSLTTVRVSTWSIMPRPPSWPHPWQPCA